MSTSWSKWKAKDTLMEYTYREKGVITKEMEEVVSCVFCYESNKDMVGQHTTGINIGVCLECLTELKKQEKELKKRVGEKK